MRPICKTTTLMWDRSFRCPRWWILMRTTSMSREDDQSGRQVAPALPPMRREIHRQGATTRAKSLGVSGVTPGVTDPWTGCRLNSMITLRWHLRNSSWLRISLTYRYHLLAWKRRSWRRIACVEREALTTSLSSLATWWEASYRPPRTSSKSLSIARNRIPSR